MSAAAFRFQRNSARLSWKEARSGTPVDGSSAMERSLRLHFARTPAGDVENAVAALELSKPARALLRGVDERLSIDECLALVPDARLSEAMALMSSGLICATSCMATSGTAPHGIELRPLIDAIFELPGDELYFVLTNQAKLRLGLIHGFRMILALERCLGQHEERALALRFVAEIWRARGEAGLRQLLRYLTA